MTPLRSDENGTENFLFFSGPPPWAEPAQWARVNGHLAKRRRARHRQLADARDRAGRMREILESLFPLMADWCRTTCPRCREVCCRMARIWFDAADLVFLHLTEAPIPQRQLIGSLGETCRCLGPAGCRQPRLWRPWRCTRFLCRPQEARLRRLPETERRVFQGHLLQIEQVRREMMAAFLRAAGGMPVRRTDEKGDGP